MFDVSQIQIGDTGNDVFLMQSILRGRGYINRDSGRAIEVDSVFGPASENSLLYFQEKNHLVKDGVCGPATWAKLLRR